MAVSVEIYQTGGALKELRISDVIGDDLAIGAYDNNLRMMVGKITPDMGVFDPKKPGRAINLVMDPNDKRTTKVNLPIPCADSDVDVFIKLVSRIANCVGGFVKVESGAEMPAEVFEANEANIKEFNQKAIKETADRILRGDSQSFCVFGAYWPVFMGREEAEKIASDTAEFDNWLISKQSMDIYYAGVNFYSGPDGIFGVYPLTEDCDTVFPNRPRIPFGMSVDGKPLECNNFKVFIATEKEKLGDIPYDVFLKKIPQAKVSRYDEADFLLKGLTEEEIKALL